MTDTFSRLALVIEQIGIPDDMTREDIKPESTLINNLWLDDDDLALLAMDLEVEFDLQPGPTPLEDEFDNKTTVADVVRIIDERRAA